VSPPRLVVLAGPTASGKSALALALAERLGGEIVSADSQQVYQGFDIGTAKPSSEELARVPHHLVSIIDGRERRMDAARYAALADVAISAICARGKVPIVVGGTGLYLRTLLHGVVPGPGRDDLFRARLAARVAEGGWEAAHQELARVDPTSAARLSVNDHVRLERALEIHHLTGQPASALRAAHAFAADRYAFLGFTLCPPREALFDRIDRRTRSMFDAGLLEETAALVEAGYDDAPPMASIGYAQARAVLAGAFTREAAIADAAQATRKYAKRQLTWFKKERGLRALPRWELEALVGEAVAFWAG
jgi:tRNA dimethylallyltransferase